MSSYKQAKKPTVPRVTTSMSSKSRGTVMVCSSATSIVSPKPVKPNATKAITSYAPTPQLPSRFSTTTIGSTMTTGALAYDHRRRQDSSSPEGYTSGAPRASIRMSTASSACSCECYGITRTGDRVRLSCNGKLCGSGEDSDCCSSDDEGYYNSARGSTRRHAIHIRS
jgi:hypothetical protein